MKIGVITDIHSNIQALDAVLEEFEKINVDKIICCGDIIGIGINPEEVVKKLMKRENILIAVRGNHEQYLINGLPKIVHDDKRTLSDEEADIVKYNHKQLSDESIEFLKKLELFKLVEIEGKKVFITHYPFNEDRKYKKFIKRPTVEDNIELFSGIDADIFLFGHTHIRCNNSYDNKMYINSGTLGCPMGEDIARAGLLEIVDGNANYSEINVKYNVNKVIALIENLKLSFLNVVLKIFYK